MHDEDPKPVERLNEFAMDCKAIIFDMDGTLLDTLGDIADAANRVMTSRGYPVHSHEAYKGFVGNGARKLIQRALPPDRLSTPTVETCLKAFIEDYQDHWSVATRPYPGITDLIAGLVDKRIQLAVVTNKPHQFAHAMMDHYFDVHAFGPILGQQDGIPPKPHPQQALASAFAMEVNPSACLFLGDSAVDMETAVRAGMVPIGAGWGFRSEQELTDSGAVKVLHHPEDLLPLT